MIRLYGITFKENNIIFSFSGKVCLVDKNDKGLFGYTVDKTCRKFKVQLENNKVVYLNHLNHNKYNQEYSYNKKKKKSIYYIEEYNPIPTIISKNKYILKLH